MTARPEVITLAINGLLEKLDFKSLDSSFMASGNCRTVEDPDIFFSEKAQVIKQAKALCSSCQVRSKCLAYGAFQDWGIFGGLTPAERKLNNSSPPLQRLSLVDLVAQKRFLEKASVSQVSRRYNVEARTVQRWRKILKNYDSKEQRETQR